MAIAQTSGRFDAYVALGCVIRGETTHYELVAGESCRGLMELGTRTGAAIGNGILTVENEAQALARADPSPRTRAAVPRWRRSACSCCGVRSERKLGEPPQGPPHPQQAARGAVRGRAGALPDRADGRARGSRLPRVRRASAGRLFEPFETDQPSPEVDREWFEIVVKGTWAAHDRLDPEIELCLAEGWTFGRLGYLLRACLRAGAFELAERADVPVKVVINEYVELAYLFFDAGEPAFVNAVLDRLAQTLRDSHTRSMSLGEFELIDRVLKPLAKGYPGALGLTDDAALVDVPAGQQLVIAKDAIVADVHFLADDPPDLIAGKLLRVNLSDLAAMGADPLGYLTVLARPRSVTMLGCGASRPG